MSEIEKCISFIQNVNLSSFANKEEAEKTADFITEILQQKINDGWIPISNMPPHLEEVIGCDKYGNREKVVYFPNMKKWKIHPGYGIEMDVIAWRPLPEPYDPLAVNLQKILVRESDRISGKK